MKSNFFMVFIVLLIGFLLSLNTIKLFELEEMNLFLTVIGLLYGLIAAFTISSAWERFSKIRDAIAEETSALSTILIFSKQLSDKKIYLSLKKKMAEYCKEVPTVEWKDYWNAEKTHEKFRDLIRIFSEIKLKGGKDSWLAGEIGEELREASIQRNQQLVLSQSNTPRVQWALNIFLSGTLVIGLTFMRLPSDILSMFVITSMITAIIMILYIIYELDGMKIAEEEVSNEPYHQITRMINKG